MYLKEINPYHLSGKNNSAETIDLIKGNDGLWYAFKNSRLPAVAKFASSATLFEIAQVLA